MMTKPVLVVDDEPMVRNLLASALARSGADVVTAGDGQEALTKFEELGRCVIFSDIRMPGMDGLSLLRSVKRVAPETAVVLITGFGSEDITAEARAAGAADILTKPVTSDELERALKAALIALESDEHDDSPLVAASPNMQTLLGLARRVARTEATVLIQGETGTGKEVLARFIHRESGRMRGPFVAVNCAALPETLIESELFGHEKGSFTGATGRRTGRFEAASGGTLLLDEVSEIPLGLQAKLLRALQEGEITRIGSNTTVHVDARVIAVSNRDLRQEVAQGRFREDLFYRLNVVCLRPPALRERSADIPLLAKHFLRKYAVLHGSEIDGFTPDAMETLIAYPWPGNVRELENAVQRAVILCAGRKIRAQDVLVDAAPAAPAPVTPAGTMTEVQRDLILSTLARVNGNRTHAAKALGVTARTIRNHLRRYRLAGELPPPAAAGSQE